MNFVHTIEPIVNHAAVIDTLIKSSLGDTLLADSYVWSFFFPVNFFLPETTA